MKKPRVIFCDDTDYIVGQVRQSFRGAPFDAEFVTDGQTLQDRALDGDFDLVVTDLAMSPVDGWTAIEGIRALKPDVPIWAVSAYLNRDMMNKARAKKLRVTLMEKPDGIVYLRESIERFFGLTAEAVGHGNGQG
jgi:CheY-like chemotaxis protein